MYSRGTIKRFDLFLADRGLRFEATVIGGIDLQERLAHGL